MNVQLTHQRSKFVPKGFDITLLLDDIHGEANIGSIFRLAEAFGINELIFTGSAPNLKSKRLSRTARNTDNNVNFRFEEFPLDVVKKFKTENAQLIALEITSKSQPLKSFKFPTAQNILLIAGNERHGINQSLLELCEHTLHINMFGANSSMNVTQAIGITLYEITKQLQVSHQK